MYVVGLLSKKKKDFHCKFLQSLKSFFYILLDLNLKRIKIQIVCRNHYGLFIHKIKSYLPKLIKNSIAYPLEIALNGHFSIHTPHLIHLSLSIT